MLKTQQPKQILPLFKPKVPEKLGTKNPQNIQHKKHQRKGRNVEDKPKNHNKQNTLNKTYPHWNQTVLQQPQQNI